MHNHRPGRFHLQHAMVLTGMILLLITPAFSAAQTMQQVQITLKEFMINPMEITVTQGQPVEFMVTNAGTIEHNFTVEMSEEDVEQKLFSTNLMPGETRTVTYTFPTSGDWEMYCPVDEHEGHGMKGEIKVLASSPGGMPSTGGASDVPILWILAIAGLALLGGGLSLARPSTR